MIMKTHVIIPAAGQGRRFGSIKQLEMLEGKPLLFHTLEAFEVCRAVSGIILAVPESEMEGIRVLVEKSGLKKILKILSGGKERQGSVGKSFQWIPPCDVVLVHDGVRPFVTSQMIEGVIAAAQDYGACVVGLPVRETMKEVGADRNVVRTVDRSRLWSVQTPQAFRYDIFKTALAKAEVDGFSGTDEAMLVERMGLKVKMIEGSPDNIKITLPEDFKIAEALLKLRRSQG